MLNDSSGKPGESRARSYGRVSRRRGLLVVLFAVMQVALPAALSVGDAYLEVEDAAARPYAHIESHGSPKCPRVHHEDTCILCNFLSRTGAPKTPRVELPLLVLRVAPVVSRDSHVESPWAPLTPTLPRAPPSA